MPSGCARVSEADGGHMLDLRRDALARAGSPGRRLREDEASGRRDDRPGFEACFEVLRSCDASTA